MSGKLTRLWATKNKNDEWWSSFVTAPLAVAANYVVVDFKWLTPNLITLLSFITALAASVFILIGGQVEFFIAAVLIHASHILDCMDGQMARYRGVSSRAGSFFDKVTDQIQVVLWFGAIGYAAHAQSHSTVPVFLAFVGVAFYSLRGYVKYVVVYMEMCSDKNYLENSSQSVAAPGKSVAGLGHGVAANLRWFGNEQRKLIQFDEGVFIFMLSIALIFNVLTPMLWVFAISQVCYGVGRSLQRGRQLHLHQHPQLLRARDK
ncbi:MAG: CDP-alcohol phosphatidyltransferase family protein [Proteobacteria bacterium]|nr:CDP-alcohol phosphatidyltransferase family protein [Pseudomonadota bacterium]